jgi:hypothetical protein
VSARAWFVAPVGPLVAALALGVGAQSARAADPALYVTFRENHTFTVTLADGTQVGTTSGPPTVIPAGKYDLFLDDSAVVSGMVFDLSGPGVKLVEDLFDGEDPSETFTETFLPNSTYTWRDDMRPGLVWVFTTSQPGSSSGGSSSGSSGASAGNKSSGKAPSKDIVGSAIKASPFRGTLDGTVSSTGKLILTLKGKNVSTLKSGRYTISIVDKTSKSGFTLQAIRKQPVTVTGVAFVGKHSVAIDLKAGQWMFYSSTGKKSYFIVHA